MAQTSYSVSPGDTILAADHNAVVTDLTDLYAIKLNSSSFNFASQAEAEAGTETSKVMNSLRTKQAINYNVVLASQAEAEAGTNETHFMNPLRTAQAIAALNPSGVKGWLISGGSAETINSGAYSTDIWNWATETLDTNAFHGASQGYVTIPTGMGGYYLLDFEGVATNNGSTLSNGYVYVNFYTAFSNVSGQVGEIQAEQHGYWDTNLDSTPSNSIKVHGCGVCYLPEGTVIKIGATQRNTGADTMGMSVYYFAGIKLK